MRNFLHRSINSSLIRSTLVIFMLFSLIACGGGSSKKRTPTSSAVVSSGASVNSATNSSGKTSANNSASNNSSKVSASSASTVASSLPSGRILMGGTIQGTSLNLATDVTTLAGAAPGSDGTSVTARFIGPADIASDGVNLYVADQGSHTIRKVVLATGVVTTLAGANGTLGAVEGTGIQARFNSPRGITFSGGNLYVADTSNQTIRKIIVNTGEVSTFAGTVGVQGTTNGTGTAAKFNYPTGITNDGANLYVTDRLNHTIRKIVIATGAVTTLAGEAAISGISNGIGVQAHFNEPSGITNDGASLYIADKKNHTIRKIIIATGTVTTLAGTAGSQGNDDGTGAAARFRSPSGITTDNVNLYVADTTNSTIRKIVIANGAVTTLAGTAETLGAVDSSGSASSFYFPQGITLIGNSLYIADTSNTTLRKLVITTTAVTTFAGAPRGLDGTGTSASLSTPYSITTDGTHIYVGDTDSHTVRKIVIATGVVSTLAGQAGTKGADDGVGANARFFVPAGITTDGTNLYVADANNHTIRKIIIATGEVTTLAGQAGQSGSADGAGSNARFNSPYSVTTDGVSLFVADTGNNTLRKIIISTGVVTTIAGVANSIGGSTDGSGAAASFKGIYALTTDGTNLYLTDSLNHTIRKMVIATGVVTTLAGTAGVTGSTDGTGATASFDLPAGIVTDGTNLYVSDANNSLIRKVVIATQVVTTLAGTTGIKGSSDGTAATAKFALPVGLTSDGINLYVGDSQNNAVRKIN
jgi:hypothetical protein